MKKQLKIAIFALSMLSIGMVNAQQTAGDVGKTEDKGQSSPINGTIRVIDNKGTKKYLQVKNGLTLLTDVTPDGGIVSTWQLGGTLTDATNIATGDKEFKITLDAGGTFVLDGVLTETGAAAVADGAEADGIANVGYTFLVRDEATGQTKKLLASSVIKNGHSVFTATADQTVYDLAALVPNPSLTDYQKVWVYRNGAKLVANVDYTVANAVVTLVPSVTPPNDWAVYAGDVIEVQFNY